MNSNFANTKYQIWTQPNFFSLSENFDIYVDGFLFLCLSSLRLKLKIRSMNLFEDILSIQHQRTHYRILNELAINLI